MAWVINDILWVNGYSITDCMDGVARNVILEVEIEMEKVYLIINTVNTR